METEKLNASERERLSFQVGFIMAAIDNAMVNYDVVKGFETICKEIILDKDCIQKGMRHYATENSIGLADEDMLNIMEEYELKE
ncbi:hypothetical protein [Bacillus sp. NPDC094106]|uniref:hypothetical protein n=1 Tax=Bacillus sp. NPDC094106 TaxID=3363949 RepID=UPI0038207918